MIVVVKSDDNRTRTSRVSRWLERFDIEHRITYSPFELSPSSVIFVDDTDLPHEPAELDGFVRRVRGLRDVRKVLR